MWTPKRFYSQNFEDLYLWRVFKDVGCGTYIDVGTNNPLSSSVSRIFFEQGWRGIHVEPNPLLFESIRMHRPNGDNFQLAVSSPEKVGIQPFYIYSDQGDGLSSLKQPSSWRDSTTTGHIRKMDVEVRTLKSLVDSLGLDSIDFIKFDVEGEEYEALRGLSLEHLSSLQYPKILLFEITVPLTPFPAPHRELIYKYLLDFGYHRIFCDGLNDYYCLESYLDQAAVISFPPNVFDGFGIECSKYFDLHENLSHSKSEVQRLNRQVELQEAEISRIKRNNDLTILQLIQVQEELQECFDESNKKSDLLNASSALQLRLATYLSNLET